MSDLIDDTTVREEFLLDAAITEMHRRAVEIPVGEPGECDLCGEDMPRLVDGVCCPCRDRRGLE